MHIDRSRNVWLISVIAIALLFVPTFRGVSEAQDPAKPDIHLTFYVQSDRSASMILEVAVNPVIDMVLRPVLSLIGRQFASEERGSFEITETTRDGRTYSALILRFDSLGDLNSFINTPNMLMQIIDPLAPGVSVPTLFSTFAILYDANESPPSYRVNARMEEGTTNLLGFTNFTTHVRLPVKAKEHNATHGARDGELSWVLTPGSPLIMNVIAAETVFLNTPVSFLTSPIIIGVVILLILVVIIVLFLQRRTRSQEKLWDDWH